MCDFYDEVYMIRDKINIVGFDLGAWDDTLLDSLREKVENYQRQESVLLHEKDASDAEIQNINTQKLVLDNDLYTTTLALSDCQKQIDEVQ